MAKDSNGNEGQLLPEDQVKHIRMTDIFVDDSWNARSRANVVSETSSDGRDEGSGITGLVKAIEARGQDTPVVLRTTVQPFYAGKSQGFTGQPYALVSGFRRFEAVRRLNDDVELVKRKNTENKTVVPNTGNGTVRAFVRTMTEKDARIENTAENACREDLDTPELVFAVAKLSGGPLNMSSVEISTAIGKTPGYVNLLQRLSTLHKEILAHWREGGEFQGVKNIKRIPTSELVELCKIDKDRQCGEYKRILESKPGVENGKRDLLWMAAAKKTAESRGKYLGTLERLGVVEVSQDMPWIDCLPVVMKIHKKAKPGSSARRKLADIMEKAYQEAMSVTDDEAGTTEAEEAAE
jgi:hypothetical protein